MKKDTNTYPTAGLDYMSLDTIAAVSNVCDIIPETPTLVDNVHLASWIGHHAACR